MNPILLAELIRQVGTVGIPLILQLWKDIQDGRTVTTVTPEQLAEVHRLSSQTSADLYARAGVPLPAVPTTVPVNG